VPKSKKRHFSLDFSFFSGKIALKAGEIRGKGYHADSIRAKTDTKTPPIAANAQVYAVPALALLLPP
jgi:hypothetical protein